MQDGAIPEQDETFSVGLFRPEDAPGIVRLFQTVYGENYPIRFFYDPAAIAAANADRRCSTIVALTDAGEVIGVTNLFPLTLDSSLYEWGAGLVQKPYRNRGVNQRLAACRREVSGNLPLRLLEFSLTHPGTSDTLQAGATESRSDQPSEPGL